MSEPTPQDAIQALLDGLRAAGQEIPAGLREVITRQSAIDRRLDELDRRLTKWEERDTRRAEVQGRIDARGDQVIGWMLAGSRLVAEDELPELREDLRVFRALAAELRPWATLKVKAAKKAAADADGRRGRLSLLKTEGAQELMKALGQVAVTLAAASLIALEIWRAYAG